MTRIAICLEYDGASFVGWQSQPQGASVQDAVEAAVASFVGQRDRVPVVCAGRTDAGVHALGQVVHCDVEADRPAHAWIRGLNALLPRTIAVRWTRVVPDAFHARFSAFRREYRYRIHNAPSRSALLAGRVAWCFRELDVEAMHAGAQSLVGEHDFSSFRSAECQAKSPVKTIYEIDVCRRDDVIEATIAANAFLHHMVRNIVGALVMIGSGKVPSHWMADLLGVRDRRQGAPTSPANGLYFAAVHYPAVFELPVSTPGWWTANFPESR